MGRNTLSKVCPRMNWLGWSVNPPPLMTFFSKISGRNFAAPGLRKSSVIGFPGFGIWISEPRRRLTEQVSYGHPSLSVFRLGLGGSDTEIMSVERGLDADVRKDHANRRERIGTRATFEPSNVLSGSATTPYSPFRSTTSTAISSLLTLSFWMKNETTLPSDVLTPMA